MTQGQGQNKKGKLMGVEELKRELQYFKTIKGDLLKTNKGQFALIKGEGLLGAFTTMEEAYKEGVARFGTQPFFIKQILEVEVEQTIPALTAHLINANI